jgi:hypothetical protein
LKSSASHVGGGWPSDRDSIAFQLSASVAAELMELDWDYNREFKDGCPANVVQHIKSIYYI